MSTPNQSPRPSVLSTESNGNVRAAVVSSEGGVTAIHRSVFGGVESAMATTSDARISESEMRGFISKTIQSFPALPETILDIYALRRTPDPDRDKLLKIVLKDAPLAANLVKISNSVVYGLSNAVKTPANAIDRLGTRMVINVAISTSMSAHLKPNLSPYGISNESFSDTTSTQGLIIGKWKEPKFSAQTEDVQFAALLQEIGALVISKIAIDKGRVPAFQSALAENDDRTLAEESVFGMSAGPAAAVVFSEWKLSQDIIDFIAASDKPESSQESVMMGARALKIAKILAPLGKERMTDARIEAARALIVEYGFSEKAFDEMIAAVKKRFQG